MGICSSCLGRLASQPEVTLLGDRSMTIMLIILPCSQDPETSRLLYDDPYRSQYGSHVQNVQRPVYQPDPESVKRERDALESVCHAMSESVDPTQASSTDANVGRISNLIDVFTIQPQTVGQGEGLWEK